MCSYTYSDPEIIEVPCVTRHGGEGICIVEIWEDSIADRYIFKVSRGLLAQSNEGIHAVLGLALMQLRDRIFP